MNEFENSDINNENNIYRQNDVSGENPAYQQSSVEQPYGYGEAQDNPYQQSSFFDEKTAYMQNNSYQQSGAEQPYGYGKAQDNPYQQGSFSDEKTVYMQNNSYQQSSNGQSYGYGEMQSGSAYQQTGYGQNNAYSQNGYMQNNTMQQNSYMQNNAGQQISYAQNNAYQPNMPQMQNYNTMQSNDVYEEQSEIIGLGEWLIMFLIMAIPFVGIVMIFVWAFGDTAKKSKANWAKAYLVNFGISIVVSILLNIAYVTILLFASAAAGGMNY